MGLINSMIFFGRFDLPREILNINYINQQPAENLLYMPN